MSCKKCDIIEIFPLTFKEFIQIYKGKVENHLEEYLLYGGLPTVVFIREEEMKTEYLKIIYEYTIFNNIIKQYKINKLKVMNNLIDILADNIGIKINFTDLCNFINSTKQTITKLSIRTYMKIIRNYFILNQIQTLNIKKMKNAYSPVKYYFTDLGMRNIRSRFDISDKTRLIENMIYNELRTRDYEVNTGYFSQHVSYPDGRIKRKHYDIDFVCVKENELVYIQICPSHDNLKIDTLVRISDKAKKFVITNEIEPTYKDDNGIVILNLYDFLLNENIFNEL